jgi:hypothetical protein
MVLVIYTSNIVGVLFSSLYLIVVGNKDTSRDKNKVVDCERKRAARIKRGVVNKGIVEHY